MCDCNENMLGANDYSLLTANTGIATISSANASMDGTSAVLVLTAAQSGTIIRSVIIKATGPVTPGMVRLFIKNGPGSLSSLYKEIPVPETPVLSSTPTPAPVLETFELVLKGDLKLANGYKLYATTQTAQSFNIIAEGLNFSYPAVLPDTCCNFKQISAETGLGTVTVANANLDGSGNIIPIFTAPSSPSNGSLIKSITIKALQSTTNNGMVRLFISDNGVTYKLFKEIPVPKTNQSAFEPSYKVVLDEDFHLQPGFVIGASTQLPESFAITLEAASWDYPI